MVDPNRRQLDGDVEAGETLVGGRKPGKRGLGAAGKTVVAGAITTDGWRGYGGLEAAGYDHHAIDLARSWGEAGQRLPAVHLVFGLAKRWLLGTHHRAVGAEYLQRYLDEFVFRFNRRRAKSPAHGFACVLQLAVRLPPATHREIVAAGATWSFCRFCKFYFLFSELQDFLFLFLCIFSHRRISRYFLGMSVIPRSIAKTTAISSQDGITSPTCCSCFMASPSLSGC